MSLITRYLRKQKLRMRVSPLSNGGSVLFSGGIVRYNSPADFTVGTGTAVVTIDGTPVNCPRYYAPTARVLLIRIPTADIITDDTSVVTVTLPDGLISTGVVTGRPVSNMTGVEIFPTTPDVNAEDMVVGFNGYQPTYYNNAIPFSDVGVLSSGWQLNGGTLTVDADGWPDSVSGGTGYVHDYRFRNVGLLWPTGNYLLRKQGAGSVSLRDNSNGSAYTVATTGSAGGWDYQVVSVPTTNTDGLERRITPPITDCELYAPGTWNTGTNVPTSDFHPAWATAYGALSHFRLMDYLTINNSNVRNASDFLPDGYYTQSSTVTRSASGTITATATSTSIYLGTSGWQTVYLVTHNAAGDPFATGDLLTVGTGGESLIERISATQFKAFSETAPTGTVTLTVETTGIIEDAIRLTNELNQDVWVCIPHLCSDAAVTALAGRILAVLEAGRKCLVELSNECWNFQFRQTQHFNGLGNATGSFLYYAEYGKRAADVHKLFLDAFTTAGRSADLVRVFGWQAAGSYNGGEGMTSYKARCVAQSYSFTAPNTYATAPYYGNNIDPERIDGTSDDKIRQRDFMMNGSDDPEPLSALQILDLAGVYLQTDTQSWVDSTANMVLAWNAANSAVVELTAYEAGQHMTGAESISGYASGDASTPYAGSNGSNGDGLLWNEALQRANRHPRIRNLQYASLAQCLDAGFVAWTQYQCDGNYTRHGTWAVREFFDQVAGPGDGTGGSHDNRTDLDDIETCEAVKLYPLQQWSI